MFQEHVQSTVLSLMQQAKPLRLVHKVLESLRIYLPPHLKTQAKTQIACDHTQSKPTEIKHLCNLLT